MKKYLFLFTISPVQAFITQARKAQDLYAGSLILSDLMKSAHKYIIDNDKNSEIIFPQLTSEKSSATHRILAEITDTNIGQEMEQFVKYEFIRIAKSVKLIANNFDKCKNQLDDFLQVYWIAKEIENEEFNYSEIERLLGAVKNVRPFKQLNEQAGRKCSLCGERNALFIGKSKNKPAFTENAVEVFEVKVNPKEGLCAVCATKRFYDTKTNFPSTARIALSNVLVDDNHNELKYWQEYKLLFNGGKDFDEQLIFKENLTPEYFKKHNLEKSLSQSGLKHIQDNQKRIFHEKKLTKYFALIRFDGDSMGKLMAGDLLKEEHKQNLKAFQIEVSKLLSNFATEANDYLIEPRGKAIFAGGDDFLGFVNLHHLFDVLAKLRKEFDCKVNKEIQKTYPLEKNFTFSAGITIAHYKTPLHAVLERTRKMEHDAKQVDGKDAFAIAVMKHSGETHETALKWEKGKNAKIISYILDKLKNEEFSSTFIQSMNTEFLKLLDEDGQTRLNDDLIKAELRRLLNRAAKNNLENKNEKVTELTNKIMALYHSDNLKKLLTLLSICDFIVRKTN